MDKKKKEVPQSELINTHRRQLFKAANGTEVGIENRPYLMELHGDRNCRYVRSCFAQNIDLLFFFLVSAPSCQRRANKQSFKLRENYLNFRPELLTFCYDGKLALSLSYFHISQKRSFSVISIQSYKLKQKKIKTFFYEV